MRRSWNLPSRTVRELHCKGKRFGIRVSLLLNHVESRAPSFNLGHGFLLPWLVFALNVGGEMCVSFSPDLAKFLRLPKPVGVSFCIIEFELCSPPSSVGVRREQCDDSGRSNDRVAQQKNPDPSGQAFS